MNVVVVVVNELFVRLSLSLYMILLIRKYLFITIAICIVQVCLIMYRCC